MLVVEMHRNFLLKVKSLDRTDIKDTASYDVLFFLNQAQDILIDKLIAENKYDLLRPIILTSEVAAIAFIATGVYNPGITGAIVVDLSALTTFRTYLRSQTKLTRSAVPVITPAIYVQNKPIEKEEIFRWETNGTNKPIFTNPKEILESKYLIILPDAYSTITHESVIYVKTPTVLIMTTPASDTCDLPAHLHQDIIDLAVKISMETINIYDTKK